MRSSIAAAAPHISTAARRRSRSVSSRRVARAPSTRPTHNAALLSAASRHGTSPKLAKAMVAPSAIGIWATCARATRSRSALPAQDNNGIATIGPEVPVRADAKPVTSPPALAVALLTRRGGIWRGSRSHSANPAAAKATTITADNTPSADACTATAPATAPGAAASRNQRSVRASSNGRRNSHHDTTPEARKAIAATTRPSRTDVPSIRASSGTIRKPPRPTAPMSAPIAATSRIAVKLMLSLQAAVLPQRTGASASAGRTDGARRRVAAHANR